jgi:prepilin-type processing-associated H-X9-DG protein
MGKPATAAPASGSQSPDVRLPDAIVLSVGGFGSAHQGGAQFAFGDGSVHFLSLNLNPQIFKYLGNRADGELIQGGF